MDRQSTDAGKQLARGSKTGPAPGADRITVDPVDPEVIARQNRLLDVQMAWTDMQVAKGVDGTVPPGHPEGSDYNQHVPALEASGEDLDDLAAASALALAGRPIE